MFWHVSVHPSICLSTPGGGYPSQVQPGRVPWWGGTQGGVPPLDRGYPDGGTQGGVPPRLDLDGGGHLRQVQGEYPSQVQPGGYINRGYPRWGTPPIGPGCGVPEVGYPPVKPGQGVPQWGVPEVGYPPSDLEGGTPRQVQGGTPARSSPGGTPTGGTQSGVLPPVGPRWGYPDRGTQGGVPPLSDLDGGYPSQVQGVPQPGPAQGGYPDRGYPRWGTPSPLDLDGSTPRWGTPLPLDLNGGYLRWGTPLPVRPGWGGNPARSRGGTPARSSPGRVPWWGGTQSGVPPVGPGWGVPRGGVCLPHQTWTGEYPDGGVPEVGYPPPIGPGWGVPPPHQT